MDLEHGCQNCGYILGADYKYCPNCGQNVKEELTLGVLFQNTLRNYFSVDARFFRSFVPLVFNPGFLPLRFVGGKRQTYLHPAQFYLFVSIVFFFLFSLITRVSVQEFDSNIEKGFSDKNVLLDTLEKQLDNPPPLVLHDSIPVQNPQDWAIKEENGAELFSTQKIKKLDSLRDIGASKEEKLKAMGLEETDGWLTRLFYAQSLKVYEHKGVGMLQAFYDAIPITLFFVLPIFALLLLLLYRKKGRFAHHMVFSFYFFSFVFVVMGVMVLLNLIWNVPAWLDTLLFFIPMVYLLLALKRFYQQGWLKTLLKQALLIFCFTAIVLPLTLFGMAMASFLLY